MQNYNFVQKTLHDLLLSNNFIKKSLYEIEKIFFLKKQKNQIQNEKHIFITGLPRSGTTALLNFLYDTNQFSSFTYENMPFVMAPNFFSKIKTSSNFQKRERFHQDGIFYDLKSPEAFDEIFFSTFSENEIKEELTNFVSLILLNKKHKRYLSKNNLNYKRIDIIQTIFPNSIFLIPFREPLQHAYSLFKQHAHFTKLQNQNEFIRRYMNYLGHNEFGKNHKSWNIPKSNNNYNDLNYWLEQWLLFYDKIFKRYRNYKNCYFVTFENLEKINYIQELLKLLDLHQKPNFQFKINIKEIRDTFDKDLYLNASNLYEQIKLI